MDKLQNWAKKKSQAEGLAKYALQTILDLAANKKDKLAIFMAHKITLGDLVEMAMDGVEHPFERWMELNFPQHLESGQFSGSFLLVGSKWHKDKGFVGDFFSQPHIALSGEAVPLLVELAQPKPKPNWPASMPVEVLNKGHEAFTQEHLGELNPEAYTTTKKNLEHRYGVVLDDPLVIAPFQNSPGISQYAWWSECRHFFAEKFGEWPLVALCDYHWFKQEQAKSHEHITWDQEGIGSYKPKIMGIKVQVVNDVLPPGVVAFFRDEEKRYHFRIFSKWAVGVVDSTALMAMMDTDFHLAISKL